MSQQKVVLIYANQGFAVRYLLQTDIFKNLKKNYRIIILSHSGNEKAFTDQFKSEGVTIEQFAHEKCANWLKKNRIQRVLIALRAFLLNGRYNTRTVDDFRKIFLAQRGWSKKDKLPGRLKGNLWEGVTALFKRSRTLRKLLIKLETKIFSPRFHEHIFRRYKPDLVILNSLCAALPYNEILAREAIFNKTPVCCIVLSWDNTSGFGMAGYEPDHVITWTDIMKRELVEFHDIDEKKISVGGIAHFDHYYNKNTILTKEALCEELDLDTEKKIIFYATKSPKRFPWGPEFAKDVAEAIESGKIASDSQLLIRIHPLHYRRQNGRYIFKDILDQYADLEAKYNCIRLNIPRVVSEKMDFNLPHSEQTLVAGILKNSDVMINMFSTMVIEACIFDTPSINVCIREKCRADYRKSRQDIMIDYHQTHNRRVVDTQGVKTVFTMDELLNAINLYLKNPLMDTENRKIVVENEAGPYKGNAGEKIAEHVSAILN